MTIQVLKEFSTATTGDTFTSHLQSGDVILWIWRGRDSDTFDGPADFSALTIAPSVGGDPVAWSVQASPNDNFWYPWFLSDYGDYDPRETWEERIYAQFWPLDDVPAGNYTLAFDLTGPDISSVIDYGAILRNVDLANWPEYNASAATSSAGFPYSLDPTDLSASADQAWIVTWIDLSLALDEASIDSIPAAYGDTVSTALYYDDGVDGVLQTATTITAITASTQFDEPGWTADPIGTMLTNSTLIIAALPGGQEPEDEDHNVGDPIPPLVVGPPTTTTTTTVPDVDVPSDTVNPAILVRISVETAAVVTTVAWSGHTFTRIGRHADPTGLEAVEMWLLTGYTGNDDVAVTFDRAIAGSIIYVNVLGHINPDTPHAGWIYTSRMGFSRIDLSYIAPDGGLVYDVLSGDTTAGLMRRSSDDLGIEDYDRGAPDGSNPLYPGTMRGAGSMARGRGSVRTSSWDSTQRIFAMGLTALIPDSITGPVDPVEKIEDDGPDDDPNEMVDSAAVPALLVADNVFTSIPGTALALINLERASVADNIFGDVATGITLDGCTRVSIHDNELADIETAPIVAVALGDSSIRANRIADSTAATGIEIDSTSTSVAVVDNDLRGGYATVAVQNGSVGGVSARNLPDVGFGGASYLSDLLDTSVAGANDGDYLVYDSGAGGLWVPMEPPALPAIYLSDLEDVNAVGPDNGQVLTWDNGTERWMAVDLPPAGSGDMLMSVYDADNNGVVDAAESVPWSGVSGAPTAFPPEAHAHALADLSDVDLTGVTDGYILVYESGEWVVAEPSVTPGETPTIDIGQLHEHAYAEDHSGECNGSLTTVILANEFSPGTVQVWLNGLRQRPGRDYDEVDYDSIVFSTAPLAGDDLLIDYEVT